MEDLSKDHTMFPSFFNIVEQVDFRPMYRHQQELGISDVVMDGVITAVKFTAAKVFYDVFCEYWGHIFKEITSEKVYKQKQFPPLSVDETGNIN